MAGKVFSKFLNSGRISLHTTCLLTSSYFVQEGFVTLVNSISELVARSEQWSKLYGTWKLCDGTILLLMGYCCLLGLQNGKLNLLRWPSLLLLIFRVIEYAIERIQEHLTAQQMNDNFMAVSVPHPTWTGHFLIPAFHLTIMTYFMWRNAGRFSLLSNTLSLIHNTGMKKLNPRFASKAGTESTMELINVHNSSRNRKMFRKEKFKRRHLQFEEASSSENDYEEYCDTEIDTHKIEDNDRLRLLEGHCLDAE